MKEYTFELPDRLQNKKCEILEFLMTKHYVNHVFSAGACGIILQMDKFHFKHKIYPKYEEDTED